MKALDRIFLQVDGLYGRDPYEATWCQHRIVDSDVEYIRADLLKAYMQIVLDHEGMFFLGGDDHPVLLQLANELVADGALHRHFGAILPPETKI